jgi:hypothetical protein
MAGLRNLDRSLHNGWVCQALMSTTRAEKVAGNLLALFHGSIEHGSQHCAAGCKQGPIAVDGLALYHDGQIAELLVVEERPHIPEECPLGDVGLKGACHHMIVAKDAEIMLLLQEEHLADRVGLALGLQLDLHVRVDVLVAAHHYFPKEFHVLIVERLHC